MVSQRDAFLSQFEEELRREVIEFGKRITKYTEENDIVIMMARKAACFAEALRALKLTSYQGIVTSQRVLDLNTDWLRNKKVCIVDDGLITGTTLYKTREKLESLGCEVKTCVLCVNKEFWAEDLVVPEKPYLELGDAETAALCSDVVDSISLVPTPYSTDYPNFGSFDIGKEDLNLIFNTGAWHIIDVSSSLQQKHEVFSKTFKPSSETKKRIKEALGEPYIESSLIKIRLYGRWYDKSRKNYWCAVLPIFAIEPLEKEQVDKLFDELVFKANIKTSKVLPWFSQTQQAEDSEKCSYKAKLRLIQYYCARKVFDIWIEDIERLINGKIHFVQEEQSLSFLFPYPIVNDILNMTGDVRLFDVLKNKHGESLPKPFHYDPTAERKHLGCDGWSIESCLMDPFLYLYKNYELPARKLALKYGKKIFTDKALYEQYSGLINRLERGFSLTEISGWLDHLKPHDLPVKKAISRFLDTAIDRGIVVPTTCVLGNKVFRGYRHGEDVVFGEGEKKLVAHTLKSLSVAAGNKNLSGKEVEKTTVITIKKLLDLGHLVQSPKAMIGRPGTIGIRFSLHGAVVEEGSVKTYMGGSGCSIRTILCEADFLSLEQRKNADEESTYKVIFDGKDKSGIKKGGVQDAKLLGKLLGDLRKNVRKKTRSKLTVEDLTLLASISSPKDLASAMAAEVNWANSIFRRYYGTYGAFIFNEEGIKASVNKFYNMRNVKEDHLFACLSSGTWKYSSFKHEAPRKIVETVHKGLEADQETDPTNLWLWEKYWSDTLTKGPNAVPEELKTIIEQQAAWLYYMRVFHTMMQSAYLYHGRTMISAAHYRRYLDQLKAEILDFIDKCRGFGCVTDFKEKALFERIDNETLRPTELRSYCLKNMDMKILEANDILTSVDCLVRPYGEPRALLEYDNIAIIKWSAKKTQGHKLKQQIGDLLIDSFKKFISSGKATAESLAIVEGDFYTIEDGIMVGGHSEQMLFFLLYILSEIHTKFIACADITTSVVFDLPQHSFLRRPKGTTEYFGHFLWNNIKKIDALTSPSDFPNTINFFSTGRYVRDLPLPQFYINKINNTFSQESTRSDIYVEDNCDFTLTAERLKINPVTEEITMNDCVDIGIVTIVSDEMRSINDFLKTNPGYQKDVPGVEYSYDFTLGSMRSKDSQWHSVACVQALGQGNTGVMPAYQALTDEFRPRLIVLLGIGGSVNADLKVCDVCIADQIINYEKRAETPDGPSHTFDPLPPIEPWLIRVYQRLERELGEHMILRACEGSSQPVFKTIMGPIGSGEAVIKDEDSHVREWLKAVSRKTGAVETEAVGAARQFQSDKLKKSSRTRGYLVVRGISDAADKDKNKEYRYVPAMNAMLFLGALLEKASKGFKEELGD